ncbi:transglycosylase family protein [Streptomyces sp. NBC_00328]|uniref:transglycosylase family protein n=1 Tax=Streptomyces sp. NBC_00328 TaxID=2903646 RepID=UPI002E2C3F29|nr:transglycosylase family protein [Streptomyces sp. NBC_00328]
MVAAGVTGSAIVIPLLAAASASAADGNTWDRVAQCESGGAWSADQSNGYYGGLQLDQENWEAHGGLDYAPRADQASRSQQIAVAEKVLADKGLAAWPTCGPLSGLSKDAAGVSVDTGVAGDASNGEDESGSYVSSGLATSPSTSPSGDSSASSDSDDSSDAAGSTAEPSASQSSDGSDAATGKGGKSAKSGQKHASSSPSDTPSTGTGRHRGGDAAESATGGSADSTAGRHAASASSDTAYVADVTDVIGNLWKVSGGLDLGGGWADLPTADATATDSAPGLVAPGQSIADTAETVQN